MVNLKISLETQRQVERAQVRKGGLPPLNLLKSSTWKGTTQLQQGTSKEGWFTPAQPTQKLNLERDHSTTTSASKEGWFTPAQSTQKLNLERDHSTTTSASKEGWFTPACSPKKAFSFLSLISQDFSFQRSSSPTPSLLLTAFLNHHPTTNPDPQPTAHLCPSRMRGSWTRDNPSPTL